MSKTVIRFTKEGFERLKEELAEIVVKRPQVLARMVAAREQGDLSENAGYHASRDELAKIDRRIRELKYLIRTGQVVSGQSDGQVSVGSIVKVTNGDAEFVYKIVGQLEADPVAGKLSEVSPIGSALIGRKIGDEVVIDIPNGKIVYKVLAVS
ncbi:transcription elongation factor GreA [Candidatus Curtissbacteria bacterium]|nr:transcription elongation factor GreA [Candidatus Curtissbacteria bacterium]